MNEATLVPELSHEALSQTFARQSLFAEKTWRLSPEAFPLTSQQILEIEAIGRACLDFMRASEVLYVKSRLGKNLLRNDELKAPWPAEYLDRGKPDSLVKHGLHESNSGEFPFVLRPDLLVTKDGFALTELDSVPGGIGLTAFLNRLYEGGEGGLVGSTDRMLKAFYGALAAQRPELDLPFIAILVSTAAATYRPEMEWLAVQLQRDGRRVFVFAPEDVMPLGSSLCVDIDGNPRRSILSTVFSNCSICRTFQRPAFSRRSSREAMRS